MTKAITCDGQLENLQEILREQKMRIPGGTTQVMYQDNKPEKKHIYPAACTRKDAIDRDDHLYG